MMMKKFKNLKALLEVGGHPPEVLLFFSSAAAATQRRRQVPHVPAPLQRTATVPTAGEQELLSQRIVRALGGLVPTECFVFDLPILLSKKAVN
jgi:hypothetical protein